MPEASKRFTDLSREVRKLAPKAVAGTDEQGRHTLLIPAKSKEVGEITIYDDQNEITIGVGKLFHDHYADNYSPSALEFLTRFLNDEFLVYVIYSTDGKIIGGGSCEKDPEEIKGNRDYWPKVRFWTWSGPYAVE